jgi:hypothetical protein
VIHRNARLSKHDVRIDLRVGCGAEHTYDLDARWQVDKQ